jgi:hypothetical protein
MIYDVLHSTMDRDKASTLISRFIVNKMGYRKQKTCIGPWCIGCFREIVDPDFVKFEFCSLACLESEKDPYPETECKGCLKTIKTSEYKDYNTCSHKCLLAYLHRVRLGE